MFRTSLLTVHFREPQKKNQTFKHSWAVRGHCTVMWRRLFGLDALFETSSFFFLLYRQSHKLAHIGQIACETRSVNEDW